MAECQTCLFMKSTFLTHAHKMQSEIGHKGSQTYNDKLAINEHACMTNNEIIANY